MNATVNQDCPSCGTHVQCGASIRELSGVGEIDRVVANWECPNCGVGYEHEHPFDTDLYERSGFHSWVGSVQDDMACIVVGDDMEPNA